MKVQVYSMFGTGDHLGTASTPGELRTLLDAAERKNSSGVSLHGDVGEFYVYGPAGSGVSGSFTISEAREFSSSLGSGDLS